MKYLEKQFAQGIKKVPWQKKTTSPWSNEFSLGKGPSSLGKRHLPQGAMNFL
jgi:hypothetical protein